MFRYIVVFCAAVLLSACATGAKVSAMIGAPTVQLTATSPLKQSLQVSNVSGGRDTNPLWKSEVGNMDFQEALQQSLSAQGMLATGAGRYRLDAALLEVKQPFIGLTFTVTSTVRYSVTEVATGRVAFNQTITADGVATVSDAFVGVERLRIANEASIKNNLSKFLDQLIGTMGTSPMSALKLGKVG